MTISPNFLLFGTLLVFLLHLSDALSLPLPPQPKSNDLSLENTSRKTHETTDKVDPSVNTDKLSSMKVNLDDLQSYFNHFREKNTVMGDAYWKGATERAMVGPVQVLDNLKHNDFDYVVVTFDGPDLSGFYDMVNTIFQDKDAMQKGKVSKKADKVVTSSIDVLKKVDIHEKTDSFIPTILRLLSTMFNDSAMLDTFVNNGGKDHISKLKSSSNQHVQKMAEELSFSFEVLDDGDSIISISS